VVTEDGPHLWDSWVPLPPGENIVVLAGRATRVPQAAVTSGMQRSVTVTSRRLLRTAHAADLRDGRRPKLHGMEVVGRVVTSFERNRLCKLFLPS